MSKPQISILSAIILLAGLTTSCTNYLYYQPGTLHMPTLKTRHDGALNINLMGAASGIPSYELNGAYAFGKKYYVAGQQLYWSSEPSSFFFSNTNWTSQYRYSELGLGMYFPFKNGTGHLLVGYGQGLNKNRFEPGYRYDMTSNRYLTQFSVIFGGKFIKIGMGTRFHLLDFKNPQLTYYGTGDFDPNFMAVNFTEFLQETRQLAAQGLSSYLDLGGMLVYSFENCSMGLQGNFVGSGNREIVYAPIVLGLHFSVNIHQEVRDKFKRTNTKRR